MHLLGSEREGNGGTGDTNVPGKAASPQPADRTAHVHLPLAPRQNHNKIHRCLIHICTAQPHAIFLCLFFLSSSLGLTWLGETWNMNSCQCPWTRPQLSPLRALSPTAHMGLSCQKPFREDKRQMLWPSEYQNSHPFLFLKERARGNKREQLKQRLFLQKFIFKPLSEKKQWDHSDRKGKFLYRPRRQGLLQQLIMNRLLHLSFISPYEWITHLGSSITHREEKVIYKRDIHPQNKFKMYRFIMGTKREGRRQNQKQGHCSQTLTFSYRRDLYRHVSGVFNY